MKKIVVFFLLPLIISCTLPEDDDGGNGLPLSDNRFNGKFIYLLNWYDSRGINERHESTILTFNGTTKGKWKSTWWNYDTYYGWNWSGNKRGDSYEHSIEIEINNEMYRMRKWNSGQQFSEWNPYIFTNDDNTLQLINFDHMGTGQYAHFQREDESLKGVNRIQFMSNGGIGAFTSGGYTTGLGEYIPYYSHEFEKWNDTYTGRYRYTFNHWNTQPDDKGTSYYSNDYLLYIWK